MRFFTSFLVVILLVSGLSSAQATIFHVNNQTGTPDGSNGIYEELQDAHDVASDGDTLIVDGSPNEYDNVTVRKRLVIMGPGYFQNENPNTNTLPASIGRIDLERASGNGNANSGAAGSIVQGMDLGDDFQALIEVNVNDVIIRKNRLKQIEVNWPSTIANQVHNLIVMNNYFVDAGNNTHIEPSFNGLLRDAQVLNNVFEGIVELPDFSKADFLNNIFVSPQFTIQNLEGVVRNNVFLSNSPTYALSADSITHNISLGPGLPAGNGNILNAQAASIFVLNPAVNGSDGQYQLTTNSAALGAGFNGTDIGLYGGQTPYITYGIGEMPVIWVTTINGGAIINPGQTLNVSVQAVSGM